MPRLRHITSDDLTIERRRAGKGFVYCDSGGRRVRDVECRARAQQLAIPPAWRNVRIARDPSAHIQALGTDAAGRLQYIYHPDWEIRRTKRKQKNLGALFQALPRIRRRVTRDLEAEAGEKALALAIAVALIDRTAMRIGRERYLVTNGTRGAGTLYERDVAVRGDTARLSFPAKSGKIAAYVLKDARLASALRRIQKLPGRRLLKYRGTDGIVRALRTGDINRYLHEIAEAPVTAKDFRTLHASAVAGEELARLERAANATARRRQVADVIKKVAAFLQNTPAISRKSYVVPALIDMFEKGTLASAWLKAEVVANGLRQREARLGAVCLA